MSYGPLRIVRQPYAFGAPTTEDKVKEYWQKLARIAPAEVTGFYLTFRPMVVGALSPQQIPTDVWAPWWPWLCVALVVFVRIWATKKDKWWEAQWPAVAVSTAAFILWVVSMGHYMAYLSDWTPLRDPRTSGICAAIFTFVAPYFYAGDPPPKPEREHSLKEDPTHAGA
jgi:hypothetical protein